MVNIGFYVRSMSLFLRNGIDTRSSWLKLTPTSPPKTYYFSFAFKDLESWVHLHLDSHCGVTKRTSEISLIMIIITNNNCRYEYNIIIITFIEEDDAALRR